MLPGMYLLVMLALLLAPQAASNTFHIDGTVVDGTSGKPIADVRITAIPGTALIAPGTGAVSPRGGAELGTSATTDADGHFSAEVTSAATRLQFTKNGYMAARPEGQTTPGNTGIPLVLSAGRGGGNHLAITMYPSAVIFGRVLDHQGMPSVNATVTPFVYQYNDAGVKMRRDMALNIRTDDRGEFRANIDAGDYFLEVRPASATLGDPPGTMLGPVYFPGVLDPQKAGVLQVKSGAQLAVPTLQFVPIPATSLHVRISNPTGTSLVRAMVMAYLKEEGSRRAASAAAPIDGGEVELRGLVPGTYRIAVECQTAARGRAYGVAEVQVQNGDSSVEIALQIIQNETISGRALTVAPTATEARPIAGVHFGLYDRIDAEFRGRPIQDFTSDASGAFRTTQHSPNPPSSGSYYVRVIDTPPGVAVTTILEGDRNILRQGYEFASGKQANLIAMVDTNPATIEGSVIDAEGKKVVSASVVLIPDAGSSTPLLFTLADASGAFRIDAAAGAYHLFAWRETTGAPWLDPAFMKDYESRGLALKLDSGAKVTIDSPLADK
jgi:hypothetical protein